MNLKDESLGRINVKAKNTVQHKENAGITKSFKSENILENSERKIKMLASEIGEEKPAEEKNVNVAAADEMISGSENIISSGSNIVGNEFDKTLKKLESLRNKRKLEKSSVPIQRKKTLERRDEAKPKTEEKPNKSKKYAVKKKYPLEKKKYKGIMTKHYTIKAKGNITKGNESKDRFSSGMDALKKDYSIKVLTGLQNGNSKLFGKGLQGVTEKIAKVAKKLITFVVVKLGLLILPVIIIAIMAGNFYGHVESAAQEAKKTVEKLFKNKDKFDAALEISWEDELFNELYQLSELHNERLQRELDVRLSAEQMKQMIDFSSADISWKEFVKMYCSVVGAKIPLIDLSADTKSQLIEFYHKAVDVSCVEDYSIIHVLKIESKLKTWEELKVEYNIIDNDTYGLVYDTLEIDVDIYDSLPRFLPK